MLVLTAVEALVKNRRQQPEAIAFSEGSVTCADDASLRQPPRVARTVLAAGAESVRSPTLGDRLTCSQPGLEQTAGDFGLPHDALPQDGPSRIVRGSLAESVRELDGLEARGYELLVQHRFV